MPNTPHPTRINIQEVRTRSRIAREVVAGLPHTTPHLLNVNAALDDTPALLTVLTRLLVELADVRRARADLAAAALATIKAHHDGESGPFYYLRDELHAQGLLPPDHWGQA